jgi:hypothetical protein
MAKPTDAFFGMLLGVTVVISILVPMALLADWRKNRFGLESEPDKKLRSMGFDRLIGMCLCLIGELALGAIYTFRFEDVLAILVMTTVMALFSAIVALPVFGWFCKRALPWVNVVVGFAHAHFLGTLAVCLILTAICRWAP